MKRCFGYIRVSTVKQGEGVSLEAQRAAIEQFAVRNDIVITQWFEEKQTAAKGGRPVFGAMLKALRRRKAEGVVMHKIDRSARNFADWAKIGDLSDAGIDVHFATESLDFRSRGGRLAADIQAVIAADYIRNLRDECLKGMNGRLQQGLYPWAAPIGYLDNGGGKPKTPDPVRAPLVRELFSLYASGQYSIVSLSVEMAKRGLRSAKDRPLTKTGVENVLGNPFYCGVIRMKRSGLTYPGVHEAIISPSVFQRVQDVKAGKHNKKQTRHSHTYRGLFRCGLCDGALTPERQKGHVYYRCQKRECPMKCVREEALENAVHRALARQQLSEQQIALAMEFVTAWCTEGYGAGYEQAIAGHIAQADRRLEMLTDALVDRLIDKEAYTERRGALLIEKARLEEERRALRTRPDYRRMVQTFLERIKSLENNYLFGDSAVRREIVEIAISNRRVVGKKPATEPSNWLRETQKAVSDLCGGHHRPTSRTLRNMQDVHVKKLVELASSEEARQLEHLFSGSDDEEDEVDLAA